MAIPCRMRLCWLAILASAELITGCSGGLATSTAPDFAFSANLASVSLTAGGGSLPVTLSATALNGFSGAINVTVTGLPSGVTASPSTLSLSAGTPQQVTLAASAAAVAGTSTALFTATSGMLTHTASVAVAVNATVTGSSVDVVTYHDNLARTGLNASETILTPANVNSSTFGLLMTLPVDGKVDGQPLTLSNLAAGGQNHNVLYAVTEHDSVYAFDADSGAQIWKVSILGANETTSGDHGCSQITPEIGITSTPVIDRNAGPHGTVFVVGMSLDQAGAYHQRLHALDATTGAELTGSPAEIRATYPGTGANSSAGSVIFDPAQYAERAGLSLLNGVIYMGWTSHCDQEPYTGWLIGYSESTLAQTSVLNLTPNGSEGSIWMSGAGLAADAKGNIYFLDANGTFDATLDANGFPAKGDFGNAFLKVATANGTLAVADYFQPYNTVAESQATLTLVPGEHSSCRTCLTHRVSCTTSPWAPEKIRTSMWLTGTRWASSTRKTTTHSTSRSAEQSAESGPCPRTSTTPYITERSAIRSKPSQSRMPASLARQASKVPTAFPTQEQHRL